jgi:hypothetical protein
MASKFWRPLVGVLTGLYVVVVFQSCVRRCRAPKQAGCHQVTSVRCIPIVAGKLVTVSCGQVTETVCEVNTCASRKD